MTAFARVVCVCLLYMARFKATKETVLQECEKGWFGERCSHQCHCENDAPCNRTGHCPGKGKCSKTESNSYFGPGCQYEDMARSLAAAASHSVLLDHNPTTCVDSRTQFVEVSLRERVSVLFLRLDIIKNANKTNVVLKLNWVDYSQKMTVFYTSSGLDIFVDMGNPLQHVWIGGAVASGVCSIYISEGRNVALRQSATQSSNPNPSSNSRYGAELAVDGFSRDRTLSSLTCSSTGWMKDPFLAIFFQYPVLIRSFLIYNMDFSNVVNVTGNPIQNFTIEIVEMGGRNNFFRSVSGTPKYEYNQFLIPTQVAKSLVIHLKGERRLLSICEIQVFGESWCPEGKYGLDCQHKCRCEMDLACNVLTGDCISPCQPGKYGYQCSRTCGPGCRNKVCKNRHGECFTCKDGLRGDYCNEVCANGTYGLYCGLNCPRLCLNNTCHHVNGKCSCPANFSGFYCDECVLGMHGDNCSFSCSANCGSYPCQKSTGDCLACPNMKTGPRCMQPFKDANSLFLLVILFILPFAVILLFCCGERMQQPETEDDLLDPVYTDSWIQSDVITPEFQTTV